MSNVFCNFNNSKYSAKVRNNKILITTKIKQDGFVNYIDVLGQEHNDLFMKELDLNEVEVVYKENIEFCYKGTYFQLFSSTIKPENIKNNRFMLFTDSEKLAQEYAFEKKEQFVFAKDITREQIEKIKIIQNPIKSFEAYGINETIIEKENIEEWLLAEM